MNNNNSKKMKYVNIEISSMQCIYRVYKKFTDNNYGIIRNARYHIM